MKILEKKAVNIFNKIDKSNWELVSFGDVTREVRDVVNNPVDEGIDHVVGLEHISPFDIHIRSWGNIENGAETFTRKFKKGQVLFGKRRAYQRKAAIADFDGICSGDILVLETNEEKMEPGLLPFLVHSDGFFNQAISTSAGSLSPRTKYKDLSEYKFRLPPRPLQKKLAELLWAVDDIENRQIYSVGKQRIFKNVFINELLTHSDSHNKWPVKPLSELKLEIFKGISIKEENDSGDYLLVPSGANFPDGIIWEKCKRISSKNIDKNKILINGDILFNTGGVGTLGRIGYFDGSKNNCIPDSFILVIRGKDNKITPEYLWSVLQSDYVSRLIIKHTQGTTGITAIRTQDIISFVIPIPPAEVQKKVSNMMLEIDNNLKMRINFIERTKNLKFSILNNFIEK